MKPITLGQVVATPAALSTLNKAGQTPHDFLQRHINGDWGELDESDAQQNNEAAQSGEDRILSSYTTKTGDKIWIITEWDHSVTTVLLPDDY